MTHYEYKPSSVTLPSMTTRLPILTLGFPKSVDIYIDTHGMSAKPNGCLMYQIYKPSLFVAIVVKNMAIKNHRRLTRSSLYTYGLAREHRP
jgi:hypothetical protein